MSDRESRRLERPRAVPCPRCGAKPHERCKEDGHHIARPHQERVNAYVARQAARKPIAPDRTIRLSLPIDRVQRDANGRAYVEVTNRDFDRVPPSTLAHWHTVADREEAAGRDMDIPIEVDFTGGKLPSDEVDIRFRREDGTMFTMAGIRRPDNHIDIRKAADLRAGSMLIRDPAKGLGFGTAHPEALGVDQHPMWATQAAPAGLYEAAVKRPPRTRTVNPVSLRDRGVAGHKMQPTLSDQLLFEKRLMPGAVPRKTVDGVKQAHRASRVFVFDRSASYRVGEICAYEPDLIADSQEFARCPYPKTFIELDANALLDAMEDAGLAVERDERRDKDERIGFLYTERGIYTAAGSRADGGGIVAGFSPFAYRPHQPMRPDQEQRFCHEFDCSRLLIDQFFWGSAYETLDPSRRRSLRAQHGLDVLLEPGWNKGQPGGLAPLLAGGGAGDLKVALCAALLLIRPNLLTTVETREPGRKIIAGKPTVFLAHRVVTIKLTPDRTVRRIRAACKEEMGRARARWHEVRGHYMHNHRAKVADCVHDWQEVEPLKWECRRGCGGRRAWRTYPEGRGSAEVGVVTKHYAVKR